MFPKSVIHFEQMKISVRKTDENYHRGTSSLLKVPNIGLVTNVALDYMHLVCLGVTKKLLLLWLNGPLNVRIGGRATNTISQNLMFMRNSVPRKFSRKPRSLTDIKYWKATEFRQFLLYTGPVVLKPVLPKHLYRHFLSLHVAVTILVSPILIMNESNINYAEQLLQYFVKHFAGLYDTKFISHNVHNLLHVCNDVRNFGILDNFRAFPFENFLGTLKKSLRKAEKPLQQLARRYGEQERGSVQKSLPTLEKFVCKGLHNKGPLLPIFLTKNVKQYKQLETEGYHIHSDDNRNNCFMLKDGTIVRIVNIVKIGMGEVFNIIGHKRQVAGGNLHKKPCPSSFVKICIVCEETRRLCYWPISEISCKMWVIKRSETQDYVLPLRHAHN